MSDAQQRLTKVFNEETQKLGPSLQEYLLEQMGDYPVTEDHEGFRLKIRAMIKKYFTI